MLDVGQHDRRRDPDRGRPRRRRRTHRPRPAPGGRARLHGRAAHEPRGDRSARSRARALVPGRIRAVRDQRRRAPDPRAPDAGGLHLPDAGRASGERRVRARARRAARLRRHRAARRAEIETIAAYLHAEQVRQIEAAARQVSTRFPDARADRAARASGAFLACEVAERLGRPVLEMPWSAAERDAAPAAALAELAAGRRPARADGRQGRRRARARGRRDALRALCAPIAEAGARHPLLVVPGGAEFADAVRAHDRRFACGRRPRTGWRSWRWTSSAGRSPISSRVPRAARSSAPCATVVVSILLPAALLAEHDPLPESWTVTSDSIAAWVAGAVGAERLVLLSRSPASIAPGHGPAARSRGSPSTSSPRSRRRGSTRICRTALRAAGVETWVIGGRDPARLAELLDEGRTAGTQVIASAR